MYVLTADAFRHDCISQSLTISRAFAHLQSAKADEEKYLKFFEEFAGFLKEGAVTDYTYKVLLV
jgi:HSP90 family molecular chaperone